MCVVYDVSNRDSFESCGRWLQGVRAALPSAATPLPGVLVANKAELREGGINSRAVVTSQVNVTCFLFSCKDGKLRSLLLITTYSSSATLTLSIDPFLQLCRISSLGFGQQCTASLLELARRSNFSVGFEPYR